MVEFTNKSLISEKITTISLSITEEEFVIGMNSWKAGAYIQDAFPTLTLDQREFIKTGITHDEWENIFK